MKYIIWESKDFKFEIEIRHKIPFLHIQIFTWNMEIARLLMKLVDSAKAMLYIGGARVAYTLIPKTDEKAIRFNKMYGLRVIKELEKDVLMGCKLFEPDKG